MNWADSAAHATRNAERSIDGKVQRADIAAAVEALDAV
jgi:hypothetical protein